MGVESSTPLLCLPEPWGCLVLVLSRCIPWDATCRWDLMGYGRKSA